jgi:membrane-associated phospholipid phosphatase
MNRRVVMAAAIVSFAALAPASSHAEESRPPAPALPPPAPEPKPQAREVYQLHLAVDIPVTVVAGSAGLVRVFFKDSLARKSCPCDSAGINRLDRGSVGNDSAAASTAADVTVYGVMFALPLVDLLDVGIGRAWGEDLMVYAETLAIDTALQNATNFITARPRPRTYAGDPAFVGSGEGYLSFYAGHVATAFSSLSMAAFTIRKRYGEQVWPWIVVGLVGGSVAFERVASGEHFPTDVAVAAVVGTGIGITVPWLHVRGGDTRVQIVPLGAHGLGLAGAF